MRILIGTNTYYPGTNGQASFTIRLAEGLARAGHTVLVLAPSVQGRTYRERIRQVEVVGVAALHAPWLHPALYLTGYSEPDVRRVLAEFRPDVVHIQDHYLLCRYLLGRAKHLGLPVLGTNHFLPENLLINLSTSLPSWPGIMNTLSRLLWWHMLRAFNRLEAATTPTETAARILRAQAIRVPVTAISCGVDLSRFQPLPHLDRAAFRRLYQLPTDRPLLAYIGRLDREKRIDLLLSALALLPRGSAHLVIAGHGSAAETLRQQSEELGLTAEVTFTGYLPAEDLPAMLNSADLFLMPSPEELQSIATIEAMAAGRPVVAAAARALPELVVDGVNGRLFQPGSAESLAAALRELLTQPERWPALGQASLARAREHDLERTIARYTALYQSLLTKPGADQGGDIPRRVRAGETARVGGHPFKER